MARYAVPVIRPTVDSQGQDRGQGRLGTELGGQEPLAPGGDEQARDQGAVAVLAGNGQDPEQEGGDGQDIRATP